MSRRVVFKFRLYVAGDALNSAHAIANLAALCRTHLLDRHDIEIVDVLREPNRALADRIFMTPTLVKLAPSPAPRKIVGTLSQTQPVLQHWDWQRWLVEPGKITRLRGRRMGKLSC